MRTGRSQTDDPGGRQTVTRRGRTLGPLPDPGHGRGRRAGRAAVGHRDRRRRRRVRVPLGPTAIHRHPEDRTARSAGHPPDPAHRARRRIRRHPPVCPRRPAAHGQLAGERAPRQPARHPAVDRPGRRRGGADRHVSRSRPARRPKRPSGRCAAPFRWCRARCAAATVPGSSRSAAVGPAGSAPTSAVGSSTGCSTRCSGPVTNSKPPQAHWRPAPRFRPVRSSSRFSTMLDTEFALSLIDLRKRGHTVVAVDVLEGAPVRRR